MRFPQFIMARSHNILKDTVSLFMDRDHHSSLCTTTQHWKGLLLEDGEGGGARRLMQRPKYHVISVIKEKITLTSASNLVRRVVESEFG